MDRFDAVEIVDETNVFGLNFVEQTELGALPHTREAERDVTKMNSEP